MNLWRKRSEILHVLELLRRVSDICGSRARRPFGLLSPAVEPLPGVCKSFFCIIYVFNLTFMDNLFPSVLHYVLVLITFFILVIKNREISDGLRNKPFPHTLILRSKTSIVNTVNTVYMYKHYCNNQNYIWWWSVFMRNSDHAKEFDAIDWIIRPPIPEWWRHSTEVHSFHRRSWHRRRRNTGSLVLLFHGIDMA